MRTQRPSTTAAAGSALGRFGKAMGCDGGLWLGGGGDVGSVKKIL